LTLSAGQITKIYNATAPAANAVGYLLKTERSNGSLMHSMYTGPPDDVNGRVWEDLIGRKLARLVVSKVMGHPLTESQHWHLIH
jgi:hypothetical protein